jgi:ABC-type multidrug transport system ATPase subunit
MLKRFYANNFRCLENFQLDLGGPSSLLIGPNGAGKSTVTHALAILQRAARGTNRVAQLVKPTDFPRGNSEAPMRFEVDVEIEGRAYHYALALEYPKGFRELRVFEEVLTCDGQPRYARRLSAVTVSASGGMGKFDVDWHVVALPIVQAADEADPVAVFRRWLARMMILAPAPSRISGTSSSSTLEPERGVENLGDWFTGLIAAEPSAYGHFTQYLVDVFPDFKAVQNPSIGGEAREMRVQFQTDNRSLTLPFAALSDGEKCFFIAATALAAGEVYGPLLCVWDEADAHLGLSEVARFTMKLRHAAGPRLQFVMSSHNPEAIRMFSDESTWVLHRANHFEPTRVSRLADLEGRSGDLIGDLVRGDLLP